MRLATMMLGSFVAVYGMSRAVRDCATVVNIDKTGLAEVSPEGPEPDFIDNNPAGKNRGDVQIR